MSDSGRGLQNLMTNSRCLCRNSKTICCLLATILGAELGLKEVSKNDKSMRVIQFSAEKTKQLFCSRNNEKVNQNARRKLGH